MAPLDLPHSGAAGRTTAEAPVATLAGLAELLAERGDATALVQLTRGAAQSTTGGSEVWSGAALAGAAIRTARGLADAGVATGDRVLVYAPASPRWIIVCLGLLRLGAVPVPVDSQADAKDLAHIVAASGAQRAFTAAQLARRLTEAVEDTAPALVLLDGDADAAPVGATTDAAQQADANGRSAATGSAGVAQTLADLAGSLDPDTAAEPADTTGLPDAPAPGAEAVLFFTSGTPGRPRGCR